MNNGAAGVSSISSRPITPPAQPAAWRKVYYRVRQFVAGLRARSTHIDDAATAVLSPAQLALFRRMPVDAQRHSVRVLRTLQREAATPPELAAAALLHDAGKAAAGEAGAYLGLWLRGPLVIAEAWAPHVLARLASARPGRSLRYAIYVQLNHPAIGAVWAYRAGAHPVTCWLIAHHQYKGAFAHTPEADLLARLQAADDAN